LIEHGADLTAKDDSGRIPGWRGDGVITDAALHIWWRHFAACIDEGNIADADALLVAAPQILAPQDDSTSAMLLSKSFQRQRHDVWVYLSNYLIQNPIANTSLPIDPVKPSAAWGHNNVMRRLLLPLDKFWTKP